jgi:hypothetical protein
VFGLLCCSFSPSVLNQSCQCYIVLMIYTYEKKIYLVICVVINIQKWIINTFNTFSQEYRPICLVDIMYIYKVLAKILPNRLKGVLGEVISNKHTIFHPSRRSVDGVVVVNEVIDWEREGKCARFSQLEYLEFMFRNMSFRIHGLSEYMRV